MDEEVYTRVLNDVPFMREVLVLCDKQPDEFPSQMLHKRINQERETLGVERDRTREAGEQAAEEFVAMKERTSDD